MSAPHSPKVFAAADLAIPQGAGVSSEDCGSLVEFWLADGRVGVCGQLTAIVDGVLTADGLFGPGEQIGLVNFGIGTFAVPMSRLSRCPAPPRARILPPSDASPERPDGGRHAGGLQ